MPKFVSTWTLPPGCKRRRKPSQFPLPSIRSYRHSRQLNLDSQTDHGGSTTSRKRLSDWQVLEEIVGANYKNRYVWSPNSIDSLVSPDRDTDANGTLEERLYPQHDANFNVTAITNTSGTVQERYTPDPFGVVTFRDASGNTISASAKNWVFLHQGGQADLLGHYDFRNRILSPTLGRWLTNDPLGFEAGDNNFYRYVDNSPSNLTDSYGLYPPSYQGERKIVERKLKFDTATTNSEIVHGHWKVYPRESYKTTDPNNGNEKRKEEEFTDINGYIIQRVTRNYSGLNFLNIKTGRQVAAQAKLYTEINVTYFEVWEVRAGKVTCKIGGNKKINNGEGSDTWTKISNNSPIDGTLIMSAEARFYSKEEVGPNPDFLSWNSFKKSYEYEDDMNKIKENFEFSSAKAKGSASPPAVWSQPYHRLKAVA